MTKQEECNLLLNTVCVIIIRILYKSILIVVLGKDWYNYYYKAQEITSHYKKDMLQNQYYKWFWEGLV